MNQLLKEWEEEQAIKAEMQDIVSQHKKLYPPKIPQDTASPIFNKVGPGPKTIGQGEYNYVIFDPEHIKIEDVE